MPKRARHAEVPLGDLKFLATLRCEHGRVNPKLTCSTMGLCNSCWVSQWAKVQLRNHKERNKKVDHETR